MPPRTRRIAPSLLALAALALAGPAAAQSAGSRIDQPTAGTLPPGTSTVKGAGSADRPTGDVSAPSRIRPSTDVTGGGGRTDPLDHLPGSMRR